jgi:hypothetical protein
MQCQGFGTRAEGGASRNNGQKPSLDQAISVYEAVETLGSQAPDANAGALPIATCLNCLSSMQIGTDVESQTATAVDFVAVKASRFTSFQQHARILATLSQQFYYPSNLPKTTWLG